MKSIDDSDDTVNKPSETTDVERARDLTAEPAAPPDIPALALRSDGKALVSVAYLEGVDLSEREVWSGVVLSEAEASDMLERVSNAADEAAGHVAGRILWMQKGKKRGDEPGEGGNEQ
jgi:hypothetical protein